MKNKIVKIIWCVAFVAALFAGGRAVVADDAAGGAEPETKGSQVKNILQSGGPEQAATIQMGLSPEQLSSLMGPKQPEQQQKKFVYKPKDPTEVEKPPRLFYNIPKWH